MTDENSEKLMMIDSYFFHRSKTRLFFIIFLGAQNQPLERNTHISHWPISLNAGQEYRLQPHTIYTAPNKTSFQRIHFSLRLKAV